MVQPPHRDIKHACRVGAQHKHQPIRRSVMQFYTLLLSAISLVAAASSAPTYTPTVQLTYDPTYDVASNSLDIVACSNGPNGLEHLGTRPFGSMPLRAMI